LLVDAHKSGSYGGTGTLADWSKAAALARQRPLLLAGGLSPDNVAEAIGQVRPWGVDVSSGVETGGVKETARIEAFIRAAHAAARQ
jgi:phosphoribosylanthranilate isomerase